MRVALFTEGSYPVARGGVTTWSEHLINGLSEHEFVPVTLIGEDEKVAYALPSNVSADEVTLVPMWGRVRGAPPLLWAGHVRRLNHLMSRLWTAVLPAAPQSTGDMAGLTAVLKELTAWHGPELSRLLGRDSSTRWILQAWKQHRTSRPDLPGLTLADAAAVAGFVDRVIALADAKWPEVDISHVATNGPSSLLALGRWWQDGTPIVLTEHGIYLRERHLALSKTSMSWTSRYAIGAFLRMLSQVTYAEATRIAPVSDFNRQWELELGASAGKTTVIYNGVDIDLYRPIAEEPAEPTVSFVGRIDPLKGLEVMIDAFALVREKVPQARLRLFGPTPLGNEEYRRDLEVQIKELGLSDSVTFEGKVSSSMTAFAAGNVVALSSISEGLPFTVIEAMMAGRATVNTDVGGVGEVVGTDGSAGLLVPPRDPAALAEGLVTLLLDQERRQEVGLAARIRALELFDLNTFISRYRALYGLTVGQPSALETGEMDSSDGSTLWTKLEEQFDGMDDPDRTAVSRPTTDPDGFTTLPKRAR